jgi:predicted lipoprotein with Yx(FWY)xxD motif
MRDITLSGIIRIQTGERMKNQHVIFLVLVVIGMLFLAGCTQQPATSPATPIPTPQSTAAKPADTIGTANSSLGTVLVDAGGKTLYYFTKDNVESNTSACTGTCADNWPAFSTDTIRVSAPLLPADFYTYPQADGTKQIAYNGLRLYTYKADTQPGDVKGDNVNKVWFAATPFEYIKIAQTPERGSYLTDSKGKALYYFIQDTPGNSTLRGQSLAEFPVFGPRLISTPSSLNPKDFTQVTRSDNLSQLAYKGMPLYYYIEDKNSGDTLLQKYSTDFYAANISGVSAVATLIPPRTL